MEWGGTANYARDQGLIVGPVCRETLVVEPTCDPPTASALTCGCRSSRLRTHRINIGGLGFLSSFFYFPWLFCKVYKNALLNNGQSPLFYRSSRAFRGW